MLAANIRNSCLWRNLSAATDLLAEGHHLNQVGTQAICALSPETGNRSEILRTFVADINATRAAQGVVGVYVHAATPQAREQEISILVKEQLHAANVPVAPLTKKYLMHEDMMTKALEEQHRKMFCVVDGFQHFYKEIDKVALLHAALGFANYFANDRAGVCYLVLGGSLHLPFLLAKKEEAKFRHLFASACPEGGRPMNLTKLTPNYFDAKGEVSIDLMLRKMPDSGEI